MHRSTPKAPDIAPGLAESSGAERGRDRLDVQAPPGREVAGRHATSRPPTSSPRWSASSTAGNSGLKGVLEPGGAVATDAEHRHLHPGRRNGNFPYLVSVFNAQTLITPGGLRGRHDARRRPGRHRRLEARQLRPGRPAPRSSATRTGGAARRRSTAREFIFFDETGPMVTAYQGGQVDAIVQFDVLSGKALLRRRRTSTSSPRRPRCIARSGCAPTRAQFADKRVRQALALTFDRPALIQTAVPGQGRARQRPRHLRRATRTSTASVPQRAQDIDKAKALLAEAGCQRPDRDPACRRAAGDPGPRRAAPEPGGRGRDHPQRRRSRASTRSTARSGAPPSRPIRRAPARPSSASSTTATAATPDVYLNAALKSQGHLELVAVQLDRRSTPRSRTSRRPSASTPRRRPATRSRPILNDEIADRRSRTSTTTCPATRRRSPASTRARLGQMFFSAACKTA